MSETSATNLDIAVERVVGFAQKFDRTHLDLACHAAFPQTLTPDLLYQIWLRFVPQAPWTAVARILLSRLCREVGYELYEMDVAVRNLLLIELKEDERFGKQQLDKLEDFYTQYLEQKFGKEEGQEEDLTQPQYWIALASTKPNQRSRKLAKAIESRLKQKNWKELFRLVSFIEAVPEALVEFEAPLITYARGMLNYTTGDLEGAAEEFSKLRRRERQVDIAGVNLSIPDEVPLFEAELAFLQRLLQIISESNDAQVVYPFLAKNVEKLNEHLAEVLRLWATNILTKAQPDEAQLITTVIGNLSNLISQFPLGDKARNIEIAITGYEIVLTVFTREAFPQQWAMVQNNLGIAYLDRIMGDRFENIERAATAFNQALTVTTYRASPYDWAMTQNNLATAYRETIKGDRAENLEQAIAAYTAALTVRTREALPVDWAATQNNLAVAYSDRIKGDRADNIEKAIAASIAALTVYTREAFPQNWAMTQNNLGVAYSNRIKGDRAENLEKAIAAYTAALTVYTREAFPQNWAMTQNNLAIAYSNRIKGDRAENLEKAIAAYTAALTVYTREAFPQNWAMTQNNLAIAYRERIKGDRAENLEQTIAAYTAALTVRTREAFPLDWAAMQNNLATAYRDRILGERAENLEMAIAAYTAALTLYTKEAFPIEWAMTQNNLVIVYSNRIKGDRAENIENAIAASIAALTVYTKEAFPIDWAITQNNLATAYRERIKGDRAENIENAIAALSAALTIRTRDTLPYDWAITQNNLATAYRERIKGDRAENIENAIAALSAALTIITREALPLEHTKTLENLGIVYQKTNQFTLAYNTFQFAITTVESLREEIVSGEESKRKQAEELNRLYCHMVEVCLELGNITEAIEYVERSKTRNLVELILNQDSKTIFPPEVFNQLETYRDEIAIGQYQIQNGKAENTQELAQHLQHLRQQRNELQNCYLPVGYGFKFDLFQATLDEHTAIIEWYFTSTALETFIITRKNIQHFNVSLSNNLADLTDWINDYLKTYYNNKDKWRNTLNSRLSHLTEILQIESLLQLIQNNCSRLVLIPHRYLHLFPLHALPLTNGELLLCEKFHQGVSYAPSCQILQQLKYRKRPNFLSIFAIQNPTGDLVFTDFEVENISKIFDNSKVLIKENATKETINSEPMNLVNCLHFSGHGYFNYSLPVESGLILTNYGGNSSPVEPGLLLANDEVNYSSVEPGLLLANNERLTLSDILKLDLSQCRLVTLSVCETAFTDTTNSSDEYINFSSAFIVAGSTSVVSSLWTIDDFSTALLMIKFYQNIHAGNTVAIALNQAQIWLRDITVSELKKWIEDVASHLESTVRMGERMRIRAQLRRFTALPDNTQPFREPFYWAAFCCIGQLESQMSPYEENILTFVYILQNQPELLTAEDRTDVLELLATLPDDVEEISNAIALWYETRPQILDAILNMPIEDLDSLRAAGGRSTPITGAESKEMIENSVTQSSKSNQPDSSSSQTKK